jgi:hypothetical protein
LSIAESFLDGGGISLSFVISTHDIEIAKKQKCYFDFFNNQTNSEAKSLYRAILSASPSIVSYLELNVDR